jgi:hypothetical protein
VANTAGVLVLQTRDIREGVECGRPELQRCRLDLVSGGVQSPEPAQVVQQHPVLIQPGKALDSNGSEKAKASPATNFPELFA